MEYYGNDFKKGDKVKVVKYYCGLDLGAYEAEWEEQQLNRLKDRPATVEYWIYDDGADYCPTADTYSHLRKKLKGKYGGTCYMKIRFDDNNEVASAHPYELEKI